MKAKDGVMILIGVKKGKKNKKVKKASKGAFMNSKDYYKDII
jgi:hypothetical protein